MNKTLTVSVLLFAVTIGFLSFADAETERDNTVDLIPDCSMFPQIEMQGTEKIGFITYDCLVSDSVNVDWSTATGIVGVIQHDLTPQELMLLGQIKRDRMNGDYIQPPIDNSTGITNLDNPICNVEHLDRLTKTDYGCY